MPRKIGNMLWRFRPRFGLRALFLAVTLVCLFLGHEVERWRGEVDALREIHFRGFSAAFAYGWWGEEREISGPEDLRAWESVVRTDHTCVKIDRLESVLSRLPNTRNIGFDRANTAEEYRTLIDLQHKYKDVDINWEICAYLPHPLWTMRSANDLPRRLTDIQIAEREWYRLKGWNTSIMQLHDWKEPTE
jgi:hypothetical protein